MKKVTNINVPVSFLRGIKNDIENENWPAVRRQAAERLENEPEDAVAHYVMACTDLYAQDIAAAFTHAELAFAIDPDTREYAQLIADILIHVGKLDDSLYYAKLATALASETLLADLRPPGLRPYNDALLDVKQAPFFASAMAALQAGEPMAAEHWFRQHISFYPETKAAYQGLVMVLVAQNRFQEAAQTLRGAVHALPDDPDFTSDLAGLLAAMGDFALAHNLHQWSKEMAPDDPIVHAAEIRDSLSDPSMDDRTITQIMDNWCKKFTPKLKTKRTPPKAEKKDTLNVGVLIGGIPQRFNAPALARILEKIDRKRFQLIGFGFGDLTESSHILFQPSFDRWQNVSDVDPITFAAMVTGERIDLMIDLDGLRSPTHLSAFNLRMAPVQASWAYTDPVLSLAAMDALLSDTHLDPNTAKKPKKAKTVIRLDGGVIPHDLPTSLGPAPPPPENEVDVVFGVDAPLKEINPQSVAVWSQALRAVPGSKLVLQDRGFTSEEAERLIDLFGSFGMAHRIEAEEPDSDQDLYENVNIVLIAPNCERPETVLDALWKGRPAIVLDGQDRHRRLMGSLLHHLGFGDDMVAGSPQDYGRLAQQWADDPKRLLSFSQQVRDLMRASKAADLDAQAKDLEKAFLTLWEAALARDNT